MKIYIAKSNNYLNAKVNVHLERHISITSGIPHPLFLSLSLSLKTYDSWNQVLLKGKDTNNPIQMIQNRLPSPPFVYLKTFENYRCLAVVLCSLI